ncbi:MAG: TonB-dependent receptor [Deltaproteobacteria bacterium]|nr:TonB-dependent receptor [Deltaproteobacteria bacterium]
MKAIRWMAMIGLGLAVLIYPLIAGAQEETKEAYRLDTMVVSATRTEMPAIDAPQSVTVLTSEQLMASPFDRVEDILRSVPGMYNFRHYALQTNGIYSPMKLRGVGNNRLLILVDGVPQNDNFNNAIAWVAWGHIPKHVIERIEIVRGPASALYGSEGLGGVIHIITKKPSEERQTLVRGAAGTAETYDAHGFYSQKFGDFGAMAAGGYAKSNGFYLQEDPASYNIKRYRKVWQGLVKATYDFTPASNLSFAALYYDHDMGQGREYFHNDCQLDQYWANFSHATDAFGLKALLYLNRADKTAYQDSANDNYSSAFRDEKFKGTYTWGGDLQGTLLNLDPALLTIGASYKEAVWKYDEDYHGSSRDAGGKGTQRFVSPFANLDLKFLDEQLIFNVGARYDWIQTSNGANWDTAASAGKKPYDNSYDTKTEGSFSPKLGVAWHPDDRTTLRASGGKGFRAPSLFELYKVHVRGGGTYYREANPDLDPEQIWSYDVGAERFLTDQLWGRVTFYQSFARDYIGDRLTGTGSFGGGKTRYEYKLDNISKVDIYGIESELQWYATNFLTLFANYTYNVSRVAKDKNNSSIEGNTLPNDPRHNAHAGFHYKNPKWFNLSMYANYYADIYFDNENTLKNDDYWTLDSSISRRLTDNFTIYFNAENIFDYRYPIFLSPSAGDTIAPGATFTCGLIFEF